MREASKKKHKEKDGQSADEGKKEEEGRKSREAVVTPIEFEIWQVFAFVVDISGHHFPSSAEDFRKYEVHEFGDVWSLVN